MYPDLGQAECLKGNLIMSTHTNTLATNSKIMDILIRFNAKLKLYYLNLHMAQNLGKIYNSLSINPVITTCKNDEKCNKIKNQRVQKSVYFFFRI